MVVFPNAKINLGLSVVGKRDDGFHNIETVFYPVPLYDVLEMVTASKGGFSFTHSGLDIPGEEDSNLCVRAWRMLQKDFGLPETEMYLRKIIPPGAGLGGGSSDGAFTVKLVNRLFALNLSVEAMERYARRLGSDCAFFIRNEPAFATGKGDRLQPVDVDLSGYFLVIVKPQVHVDTREAYGGITTAVPDVHVNDVVGLPVKVWKENLINDFEKTVLKKYSVLGEIKERLYSLGALYASMTGSGSAIYGLFENETDVTAAFQPHFCWCRQL